MSQGALLYKLVNCASKGGNLLLNVGPTAEGVIPQRSEHLLLDVGDWLKRNGEAIYGTKCRPFPDQGCRPDFPAHARINTFTCSSKSSSGNQNWICGEQEGGNGFQNCNAMVVARIKLLSISPFSMLCKCAQLICFICGVHNCLSKKCHNMQHPLAIKCTYYLLGLDRVGQGTAGKAWHGKPLSYTALP